MKDYNLPNSLLSKKDLLNINIFTHFWKESDNLRGYFYGDGSSKKIVNKNIKNGGDNHRRLS